MASLMSWVMDFKITIIIEDPEEASVNSFFGDELATEEYYDLQGIKVNNPIPGRLYIIKKVLKL